ncbi:MAG: HK97 family phage prohead protease [Acidimicrobiales bacterium]
MSTIQMPDEVGSVRYAVAPIQGFQFRDSTATPDGSWRFDGYAAVYDTTAELYDGQYFRVTEEIASGAFTTVLARLAAGDGLVHLNFGHDMNRPVAASNVKGIGGLLLEEDAYGLRFRASVDREDPDAQALAVKMRRGVIAQASFAFQIGDQETVTTDMDDGREHDHVRILQVKNLYDVCACAQGAYPQTIAGLRSIGAALGLNPPVGVGRHHRPGHAGGGEHIDSPEGEGVPSTTPVELARARARSRGRLALIDRKEQ